MLVRYADMVKESKDPASHDCAHCREAGNNCFSYRDSFVVGVPAKPEVGKFPISEKADVPEFMAWYRRHRGVPFSNDLALLKDAGICPAPLLTPLSVQLYNLYQDCQASGQCRLVPGGYYDQSAFFIRAMGIISAEEAQIRAERRGNDG